MANEEQAAPATPAAAPAAPGPRPTLEQAMKAAEADAPGPDPEPDAPAEPAEGEPAAPAEEAAPPTTPEEVRHSQRLAELARREQAIRKQERTTKQAQQEVAALRQQVEQAQKEAADFKVKVAAAVRENPFGTLKDQFGLDILDVLQHVPSANTEVQREAERVARLEQEFQKLRAEREAERVAATEAAEKQRHGALYSQALSTIHRVVAADPDKHEAILDQGRHGIERVYVALNAMYEELVDQGHNPGPPNDADIAAAARIVEEATRQEELADLKAKSERKRYAGRLIFGEPPIKAAAPAKAPTASTPSSPKTLTGALQGDAPQHRRLTTAEERYQAALQVPYPKDDDAG